MQTAYDAIIIGGGPAGSSAAILLSQAGWSVALLEAKPFPRRKVCGECIAGSNLPLLDALGIGEALRRSAGPQLRRVALWRGEQSITSALPPCAHGTYDGEHSWGLALGREHLDLLLVQRAMATGADVFQPCRAVAVRAERTSGESEVVAVDAVGAKLTLRTAVLICAYGSWQPPPAGEMRWERAHRPSDLLGFKANFRDTALDPGVLPVLAFAGGYGGMVVAGEGLATLACCIRRDRLAACRRDGSAAGASAGDAVEALLRRECGGAREALADASRVGPWLSAGPIRPGVRLANQSGGAFLIGNAAGEAHPIIGEGISIALQSAWLLCEELANSPDACRRDARGEICRHQIQERYTSQWRQHFTARIRLAACFAHAAMRPAIAAPLLPLLRRAPGLLGLAARASGKTRCAITLPSPALPGLIQGSST